MILAKGNSVTLDGKDYSLVQFLFLTPSEHTISGKQYALEVHFVNMAADVELAAFGVLGKEGARANRAWSKVSANLNAARTDSQAARRPHHAQRASNLGTSPSP
ncbi:unannotated protein [freshwater metagenome]|uniref:carbonic anhydrase n=1 Tax=freshwater metagenome TaxID=449393 RepID=A0A6J6SV16_9ZZZZ